MKFGQKLTLVLLGVLALVLSLSTLWTHERQFSQIGRASCRERV